MVANAHHRQIVKGLPALYKCIRGFLHAAQDLSRSAVRFRIQLCENPLRSEHLVVGVHGFRKAVRIHEQRGAGLHPERIFPVPHALHAAEDKAVLVPDHLEAFSGLFQHRVFVSGIGAFQLAGVQVQDAEPHGDEHLLRIVRANGVVCRHQHLRRGFAAFDEMRERDLRSHHKQSGGDPLSGHIRDHQAETALIHEEEIVEISPDLLRRGHRGIDLEILSVRVRRERGRQHGGLDPARELELRPDALPLGGDPLVLHDVRVQLLRQIRHVAGELRDLIVRPDLRQLLRNSHGVLRLFVEADAFLDLFQRPQDRKQDHQQADCRQQAEDNDRQRPEDSRLPPDRFFYCGVAVGDPDQHLMRAEAADGIIIIHEFLVFVVREARHSGNSVPYRRLPFFRYRELLSDRIDLSRSVAPHVAGLGGNEEQQQPLVRLLRHDTENVGGLMGLFQLVDIRNQSGIADLGVKLLILLRERFHIPRSRIFRRKARIPLEKDPGFLRRNGIPAVWGVVLDVHLCIMLIPVFKQPVMGRKAVDVPAQILSRRICVEGLIRPGIGVGEGVHHDRGERADRDRPDYKEDGDLEQHTDFFLFYHAVLSPYCPAE